MQYIKNHMWILFILILFVTMFSFFFLLGGKSASAEAGCLDDMKGYESILIKQGDTVHSIANIYSDKYSHLSCSDYYEAILSLNSLESEHIKAGSYLLLPVYC